MPDANARNTNSNSNGRSRPPTTSAWSWISPAKLGPDIRRRIDAVVSNPSQKTWEDAHSIIVGSDGSMTLWQAVLAVDPSFLRTGPYGSDEWDEIPDQKTLLKAIQYATH